MVDMVKRRRQFRAWQKKYNAKAPKGGDVAPDFELSDSKGENPVRLSSFRGHKPVALLFGSYT